MYKNLFVFQICAFNMQNLPLKLPFMMSLFLCRSLNIITNLFRYLSPILVMLLQNLTTFSIDKSILYHSDFNLTLIYSPNIKWNFTLAFFTSWGSNPFSFTDWQIANKACFSQTGLQHRTMVISISKTAFPLHCLSKRSSGPLPFNKK